MKRLPPASAARRSGTVILGRGWHGCGGRLLHSPAALYVARTPDEVRPALNRACEAAADGFHVAGYVAYDAAPGFDDAFRARPIERPLVWMAAYRETTAWSAEGSVPSVRVLDASFEYSRGRYREAIAVIREHIRQGNVYQVNFTGPLDFRMEGVPYDLFRRLLQSHPVPYGAYLRTSHGTVVSCSPELFFRRSEETVVTRPMKGTVRRGLDPEEDARLERWLAADAKSRAENLMIVDLLRNDLSKCCDSGAVRVSELFAIERYETVFQMTSQVEGTLRRGAGTEEVVTALFPCGSVTGAPKIRAMEVIEQLESGPRGIYCGAIGYMHRDAAVFNVAIRTIELRGSGRAWRGKLGIGSGVVWDSDADAEFDECMLKARFLTDLSSDGARAEKTAPLLIETMRVDEDGIALLEYHLDRLRASARGLGYPLDEAFFRSRVSQAADRSCPAKLRATLAPDGSVDVRTSPLDPDAELWDVTIAEARIDSSEPHRRHKTTARRLYDETYRAAVRKGFDEVIFLNEREEVAEGSRTNVFAVIAERWVTPPIGSGALPGVYRRRVLETRQDAVEAVLTVKDLLRADSVYVCNAVRGLVRARLAESAAVSAESHGEASPR